ncbi:MAG: hypothetical protein QM536_01945 [Chitinophagaceae bacterium]|nr:hypothetical protein [Chitinophagaceae bacterium]
MKKQIFIAPIILTILSSVYAQAQDYVQQQRQVFEMAKAFNDPLVARTALYNIITLEKNSLLLDTLALYYYQYQNYTSSLLVAQEALKYNTDNNLMRELLAISYEELGVKDKALAEYETLYLKNNSFSTLYKIAFLQYQLKRYVEASTSLDILFQKKETKEEKMIFTKLDKTTQEVHFHSVLHYIKGLIASEQNKIQEAKQIFLKSLEITPQFEQAQISLRELQQKK